MKNDWGERNNYRHKWHHTRFRTINKLTAVWMKSLFCSCAMVYTRKISLEKKAYLFYCFRDRKTSAIEICRRLNISKASFYRIYTYFSQTKNSSTKVKRLPGRRRILSERQIRILLRTLKILRRQEGNFSVSRLMEVANINRREVSVRTVRRVLNEQGFKHVQARKKGILTEKDLAKRLKFARRVKREYPKELWTDMINFYLDGVSFYYKTNPASQARVPTGRIWRKKSEGLLIGCTAKGKKEGRKRR